MTLKDFKPSRMRGFLNTGIRMYREKFACYTDDTYMLQESTQIEITSNGANKPPAPGPQAPVKEPFNAASWGFFNLFVILSIVYWLLHFAYQYYVLNSDTATLAVIRASAFAGSTLISASLLTSVIFKWKPQLAKHWHIRRYLGVAGFVFVVMHVTGVTKSVFAWDFFAVYKYSLNPFVNPLIFGVIGFYILFTMALTSTDWAQKKLGRNWKRLHRLIYVGYPAMIFHFLLTNPAELKTAPGYLLLTLTTITVVGQLYWFFKISASRKFRSVGFYVGLIIIVVVAIVAFLAYR